MSLIVKEFGIENSIQSALKFIEINPGSLLTCSDEKILKNGYIYHLIINSLCLNQNVDGFILK